MAFGLVEPRDLQALRGERGTVGNGVADGEPIGQFAILLLRIELVGDAAARLLGARATEPFRYQFDANIDERANQGHHQDDESPGLQAPGS